MDANDSGFSGVGDPGQLVGSIVADRYVLGRLLSAGANTLIFDADDSETQRPVTLKALRPDLVVDSGFRDRFDDTIRNVAAITHPNIAAVHDWGVAKLAGQPTAYVVSERLGGGSLRDLYDRGRRLSPSQALALGLDVCRGLDHAHRRGLVHGELSPAKLVFGNDRRVRIVDFGLTALLAEHVWAEPSSVPTHVARYSSPEQALGIPVDGTTDVYALCLSLVEGVTGVLPFASDSTVSTLAARVGRLMPVSADLGPLASVFERAGRPEAADRATAAQFGRGLVQAAEKLPRPEPLPLLVTGLFDVPEEELRDPADPTGGVRKPEPTDPDSADPDPDPDPADDPDPEPDPDPVDPETNPTDPDPVADPVDPDPDPGVDSDERAGDSPDRAIDEPGGAAFEEPNEPAASEETEPLELLVLDVDDPPHDPTPAGGVAAPVTSPPDPSTLVDEEPVLAVPPIDPMLARFRVDTSAIDAPVSAPADVPHQPRVRSRRWKLAGRILVPILILAALAALALVAVRLFVTPTHEVPALAGVDRAAAETEIADFGWDVTIELARSDEEPRIGHVIRTVPGEGERLAEGEPFLMVVSEGPVLRPLPELVELSFVDAELALEELDLVPILEEEHHEEVPRGAVIRWQVVGEPDLVAGDEVLPGTEVEFVSSLGPAPRTVPDLLGATLDEATAALDELRLVLEELDPVFDDDVPVGQVVTQSPPAESIVSRGAIVEIAISLGPDVVEFPDLAGTDFVQAQALLAEQGLIARLEFGAIDGEFLRASVDGAEVAPGELVRRGSQVDVIFL